MIELTRTKRITAGLLLMLGVILTGLLTMTTPKYYFKSDPSLMISELKKGDYQISPSAIAKEIINKNKNFVFVDIRSPYEFSKGNIEGSVNIPASDILDDDNYRKFSGFKKDGKSVCLYGKDLVEANVPFMTLNGLGFDNLKILQGGYDYFKVKDINTVAGENIILADEAPLFDIQKFIKDENIKSENNAKQEKQTGGKSIQVSGKKSAQAQAKKAAALIKSAAVEEEGC